MKTISEIVNSLLNSFWGMSRTYREIFKLLQWWSRKFREVCISHKTLAIKALCSEKTVYRAITYFRMMGWLGTKKRYRDSNKTFLDDELIKLDLKDRKLFERDWGKNKVFPSENVQSTVHTISPCFDSSLNTSTDSIVHSHKAKEKRGLIPKIELMTRLNPSEKNTLYENFSEFALNKAVEDFEWWFKKGGRAKSTFAVLWAQAKKACNKMREFA